MSEKFVYTHRAGFNSSVLDEAFYDAENYKLIVKFKHGSYAGYLRVPLTVWNNFVASVSSGSFYNREIRNYYSGFSVPDGLWFVQDRGTSQQSTGQSTGPRLTVAPGGNVSASSLAVTSKPKFRVVADVTAQVDVEIEADDLADAMKEFVKLAGSKLENPNVVFRAVTQK